VNCFGFFLGFEPMDNETMCVIKNMYKQNIIILLIYTMIVPIFAISHNSKGQNLMQNDTLITKASQVFFDIRYGQGGFSDKRSDIDMLGGGQLAFDISYGKYPIILSISGEYYTNSADPTHNYEIPSLTAINILYVPWHSDNRNTTIFAGGGAGWLEVPRSEDNPDKRESSICYNLEAGINQIIFWKFGLYGTGKYLYAKKKVNGKNLIDFNELIFMVGITLNLSF
jgi:hypothetical protein